MSKFCLMSACLLTTIVTSPALAANTFQNTCSEIHFAYASNDAALKAVCLRADGTPNATSLTLQGISNQNGKLTQGTGPSFRRAAETSRSWWITDLE